MATPTPTPAIPKSNEARHFLRRPGPIGDTLRGHGPLKAYRLDPPIYQKAGSSPVALKIYLESLEHNSTVTVHSPLVPRNTMESPRSDMSKDPCFLAVSEESRRPWTPLSPSMPVAMAPINDPIPQLPITPPASDLGDAASEALLDSAVHVLTTEATALSCLARLYQTDPSARDGFSRAVNTITSATTTGGKLIVCGVGKSGKIGEKLVATMNSLGVFSAFLHPVEALHGDMGIIRPVCPLPILVVLDTCRNRC